MKNLLLVLVLLLAISSCRDEFNDPNPDYEEIVDLEAPRITALNLKNDSIHRNIDTLEISLEFRDDLLLGAMNIELASLNVSHPGMKFSLPLTDTFARLDTFYLLPAVDTTEIAMIIGCEDYAGNSDQVAINLEVVN